MAEHVLQKSEPNSMLSELEERMKEDYPQCGTCQTGISSVQKGFLACIDCKGSGFNCEPVANEAKSKNNIQAQSLAGVGKRFSQLNSENNVELDSQRPEVEQLLKPMSLHNISPDDTDTSFYDSFQGTSDEEDCDDYSYNNGYETSEDELLTKTSAKDEIAGSPRSGNESYEMIGWENTNGVNTRANGGEGGRRKHRQRKRPRGSYAASSSDDERCFACPYYKYDSDKHQDCRSWFDSSLSRVKAHVLRTHLKPLQCDRCGSYQAGDQGQIRAHLRRGNCEKPEKFYPLDEKIIQKGNDLKKNSGKTRTWPQLFVVLFEVPESAVPSPYYESVQKTSSIFERLPEVRQQPSGIPKSFSSIGSSLSNVEGFEEFAQEKLISSLTKPLLKIVGEMIEKELPNVIAKYRENPGEGSSSPATKFSTAENLGLPTPSNSYHEGPNFNQATPNQNANANAAGMTTDGMDTTDGMNTAPDPEFFLAQPRGIFPHMGEPYNTDMHIDKTHHETSPSRDLNSLTFPSMSYHYVAPAHQGQIVNNNDTYYEPENYLYPATTGDSVAPQDLSHISSDGYEPCGGEFSFIDDTFSRMEEDT
ncbi:hypothetical protein EDC01DRAFT_332138 [Geopyxis carbonaria]|nr:hypothetical protein EDC01DRAFT_332138 [Geopyxis carbonaria]